MDNNINTISNNIFKDDLQQYTFIIPASIEKKINNNIFKKNKYILYESKNKLLLEYLFVRLAKFNMIQVFDNKIKYVDIIFNYTPSKDYHHTNENLYNIKSSLINTLSNVAVIKNKKNLYFNMLNYNSKITKKYFAETLMLKNIHNINDIYILRPFGKLDSGSGLNIHIVSTNKELNDIKNKVDINSYIGSKYITNPLLFKNKKFHLRVTFMVTNINNEIDYSIFKHICIYQAKLPYINENYLNKEIHDTHIKSTDDDYLFYDEFKDNINYNKIIEQIKLVIKECFNMAKNQFKIYPENKNAYHLFGCDFMILDDYNVKLLEINGTDPGYDFLNVKNNNIQKKFNKDYFGWIFNKTIIPIFFPKLLLFDKENNIKNKYYDVIKNNDIYIINLNIVCENELIYYIIIINLLCPYKKSSDITIINLTNDKIWKNACDIIKCNYMINNNDNNKYDKIINNELKNININIYKKYIIMNNYEKNEFYKGIIKFNDKNFYIYKK